MSFKPRTVSGIDADRDQVVCKFYKFTPAEIDIIGGEDRYGFKQQYNF